MKNLIICCGGLRKSATAGEIRHNGEVIEGIDFIEMMREFGRLVILRIENPYNMMWRIEEIRHIGLGESAKAEKKQRT